MIAIPAVGVLKVVKYTSDSAGQSVARKPKMVPRTGSWPQKDKVTVAHWVVVHAYPITGAPVKGLPAARPPLVVAEPL